MTTIPQLQKVLTGKLGYHEESKTGFQMRTTKENNSWLYYNSVKILRVTHPKGRREIKKGTLGSIIKQLNLQKEQFENLIACSLSREDYFKYLKNKNVIQEQDSLPIDKA